LWKLYGIKASENRVRRIMQKASLRAVYVKKMIRVAKKRASIRNNPRYKCVDHVKRQYHKFTAPNQCWYTDVSVHAFKGQHFYQSTIIDAYTFNIVDFKISYKNDNDLIMANLEDALKKQKDPSSVIIHSDHGAPYFSNRFIEKCKDANLIISKGNAYTCADNVQIESFHSHLKKGTIHNNNYRTIEEYWTDVQNWNEWFMKYKSMINFNPGTKVINFSK
jgi:putative transposase